jgi:hypothetical protein
MSRGNIDGKLTLYKCWSPHVPFEGLSNIPLLRTINDLNLVDHLKAFKHRKG